MSDYLWEKAGAADPEVVRLEALLSPFAYRGAAAKPRPKRNPALWLSVGALALAFVLVLVLRSRHDVEHVDVSAPRTPAPAEKSAPPSVPFDKSPPADEPRGAGAGAREWIDTSSAVTLQVPNMGEVLLAKKARARIVESGAEKYVLELASGKLSARIQAPPRHFAVRTPRATIYDLGCAFEIEVSPRGTHVVVTEGSVAIVEGEREQVLPAGKKWDGSSAASTAPARETPAAPPPTKKHTVSPKATPEKAAEPKAASGKLSHDAVEKLLNSAP
jgi:ferric-dicitrate binding protein FerR (iron transport regulator)